MFRSCQIIIRELCSLLKIYYSIHNSIRIYKRGVVAAHAATTPRLQICEIMWNYMCIHWFINWSVCYRRSLIILVSDCLQTFEGHSAWPQEMQEPRRVSLTWTMSFYYLQCTHVCHLWQFYICTWRVVARYAYTYFDLARVERMYRKRGTSVPCSTIFC